MEDLIDGKSSAIHLMDREGDNFPLFCHLKKRGARFVIRMARDRTVESENEQMPLSHAVISLPKYLEREVPLSRRAAKPTPRSAHGQRDVRVAKLSVSAGKIALRRPRYGDDELPEELEVNVVYVQEVDPPKDEDPVAWVLVTTEPIETPEQVAAIVDHYRARWLIEEFFKALKTGCAVEKRQLESFGALTNALALFLPIAWQMLLLRSTSRTAPDSHHHPPALPAGENARHGRKRQRCPLRCCWPRRPPQKQWPTGLANPRLRNARASLTGQRVGRRSRIPGQIAHQLRSMMRRARARARLRGSRNSGTSPDPHR